MAAERHKHDTSTFEGLIFAEQAKSINATIINLERAIRAHIRRAPSADHDPNETRAKCISQLQRMLARISE